MHEEKKDMTSNKLKVVFMEEAFKYIKALPQSAGDKVLDNIHRIESGERNVKLFKKLEGSDIWEFRTLYNGIQYRLFSFWDTETETLVIATHGFIKKTQKTPSKEIAKAERLRKEYFSEKR